MVAHPAVQQAYVVAQPGQAELREIAVPTPDAYEALVRMHACGICNSTDRRVLAGRLPFHGHYPAVLGHESVGTVVEAAGGIKFPVGKRATRVCAVWPGQVLPDNLGSAWGGFAEYGLVRDVDAADAAGHPGDISNEYAAQACVVPDDIPDTDAALAISLAEIHSWLGALGPLDGKRVVVLGTGIAGYAMTVFAKAAGATVVILGRRGERLARARALGADEAIDTAGAPDLGRALAALGGPADFLLEATGDADEFLKWLPILGPGGTGAIYGIPDDAVVRVPLGSVPQDFRLLCPKPREARSYAHVCQELAAGRIRTGLLLTHVWRWPHEMDAAWAAVAQGQVVKGIVVFPGATAP